MPRPNRCEALPQRGVVAARLANGGGENRGRHLEARLSSDEEEWCRSVWVGRMAQARQEEAHLGAIVETGSAARAPWNPEHVQAAANLHAVDVRAHEHRVISGPSPTRNRVADLGGDPIRLVRRGPESAEGHWRCIAGHPLWGELL